MRFSAARDTLSGVCRNLARIVPEKSPIADLTGILMEADENTGNLRLTANNMEIAIQYDCPAVIEEGGIMVINAKLISEMIPMFAGERVFFSTPSTRTVHIQSASAGFHISCLPGVHYPKPVLPEPESMVTLAGIGTLAKQTAFAAKKPRREADIYANVKLEVSPAEIRMIATDTLRLAIARHRQASGGQATMLIPTHPLSVLSCIAGDAEMKAGVSQNSLVFKGTNFVFTCRTMAGIYMDVNNMLKTIEPMYDALVPASDLWNGIDSLGIVVEDGAALLHLIIRKTDISLSYKGENSSSHMAAEAVVYHPTPKTGFYYSIKGFLQALRFMEGNILLMIDRNGMVLLKNENQCYMLSPVRPRKPIVKKEKKTNTTKTAAVKAA